MVERIIIYGCGGTGRSILSDVKKNYPDISIFFSDTNKNLWGTDVEGIEVISPYSICSQDKVVIATSQGYKNVKQMLLNDLGIDEDRIDESFSRNRYNKTFAVRDEFIYAFAKVVRTKNIPGCCAEGGVFEGDFAAKINDAFSDRKLYLFDTFEGFDERDLAKEDGHTSTRKNLM